MPDQLKVGPAIGLCLLTLLAFVPVMPAMPRGGLDPSWAWALNEGSARHLSFGRDLVFTFGPLGVVATRLYHPATDTLMLGASTYIGLATAAALYLVANPGNRTALMAFPFLIAAVPGTDAVYLYLPILFALAGSRAISDRPTDTAMSARTGLLIFMASSLSLLPLIKASLAVPALVSECAILLGCARRSLSHAAVVATASVSVFLAGWVLAGQPLAGLSAYLRTSLDLVSGYTTAMALYGAAPYPQTVTITAYAVCAAVLSWLSVRASGGVDRRQRAVQAAVILTAVAMAAKAAFVRYDLEHISIGPGFLLLLAGHAVLMVTPRRQTLWIAAAMLAWACTFSAPAYALARPIVVLLFNLQGVQQRIGHPEALPDRYRAASTELMSSKLAALLVGGVDVYPADQAVAIANASHWAPRPVFQSYAAYTPLLAALNAAHLEGTSPPQTLLFRVNPIDGRFPALDDGLSWLRILSSYRLRSQQDRYAVLERFEASRRLAAAMVVADLNVPVGATVPIPSDTGLLWAEVDWQPTALGRIVAAAFKLPEPRMAVGLGGTESRDYRFVPSVGTAGFLLSPLVQDTSDFLSLLYGAHRSPLPAVTSVRFYCGVGTTFCGLWNQSIHLRLRRVQSDASVRSAQSQ